MYLIGDISKQFDLSISTIRYYDKEGLLKDIDRSASGIRVFTDKDIETIKVIECLKKAGMKLKDIKIFIEWCECGDKTINLRKQMFLERKKEVIEQINELKEVLNFIEYKCWYYDEASKLGSADLVNSNDYSKTKHDTCK